MITSTQFYKGRDTQYASELTDEIRANSTETLRRANALLNLFYEVNPDAARDRGCNSGWRPPGVNASTKNAAPKSKHMLGLAIDIGDDDGQLDKWLMSSSGKRALTVIGLWMEDPSATPRWSHVQTIPPKSGNRVFLP